MRALPLVLAAALMGALFGACDFPSVPSDRIPRHLEPVPSPNPGTAPLAAGDVVEADGILVSNAVTSVVVRTTTGWVSVTVGPATSITLNGTAVGLRSIQPGYPVHVSYRSGGPPEASRLAVSIEATAGSVWRRKLPLETARQQNLL